MLFYFDPIQTQVIKNSDSAVCESCSGISAFPDWIHLLRLIKHLCFGTIFLRRQHVLGGEGCPHVLMVKMSQYISIKNLLHKHFAGMPMVGG